MDYQFNAHGVELGQRYRSGAIRSTEPFPEYQRDPELFFQPDTVPGSHLPYIWVQHNGEQVSTLDVAEYAGFTLLTGIGVKAWTEAAKTVATELGVQVKVAGVGLRQEFGDLQESRHCQKQGARVRVNAKRTLPGGYPQFCRSLT